MVRRVYQDRVRFHDGDVELVPGVSLHLVGDHTMGLQVVRVMTRRGAVVLASDASHLYANMEQSPEHIIPGHDPLVMERYPAPSDALRGVAARLD